MSPHRSIIEVGATSRGAWGRSFGNNKLREDVRNVDVGKSFNIKRNGENCTYMLRSKKFTFVEQSEEIRTLKHV